MTRGQWLSPCVVALGLTLACAPDYFLAPQAPPARSLPVVALLPLNYAYTPPNAWLDGLEVTSARIREHLEAAGLRVEKVPLSLTFADWERALSAVGGVEDASGGIDPERYAAARAELARRIAAQANADAVVMATVLWKVVPEGGWGMRWDGVRRSLSVDPDAAAQLGAGAQNLKVPVTSLRVTVFDAQGNRLFERVRGFEVGARIGIRMGKPTLEDRGDLFRDEALLDETVRIAFAPYVVVASGPGQ